MKYFPVVALIVVASAVEVAMARVPGAPPEARAACSNKTVGAECGFTGRRGRAVNGQCYQPQGGELVCRPEHRGQRQGQNNARRGGQQQRGPGGGRFRTHNTLQTSGSPALVAATQNPIASSSTRITQQGNERVIQSNGIAEHKTGAFPNSGNPNPITLQQRQYRIPMTPQATGQITDIGRYSFGVAVNGVPFDPNAAEAFESNHEWKYEALSGAVALGIDTNYAHVQPTGTYHYHGQPTGLMQKLGVNGGAHSPIVGWAADGFPIYALYGSNNAGSVVEMTSGYRVKSGQRPGGDQPGGQYDGTFVRDYQYVPGAGTLDECNGGMTVTADFPQGTYAYFITESFPVIPRCFKGTPSDSFKKGGVPGMRG